MEDSPALGASQVGGLPDVVPEGTLLNMVLKRMHRPRSCSYQLLLEHQRPSCIQGLRWVSAHRLSGQGQAPRTAGGPGLGERACFSGCGGSCWAGQWVKQLGRCARGWLTQLHRVRPCACGTRVFPLWPGGRREGFVICVTSVCPEVGGCVFSRW